MEVIEEKKTEEKIVTPGDNYIANSAEINDKLVKIENNEKLEKNEVTENPFEFLNAEILENWEVIITYLLRKNILIINNKFKRHLCNNDCELLNIELDMNNQR